MLTSTRSTYLTKDDLAQVLGVREALVRQWTRDRTIPEHFYYSEGTRYLYAPITVALGELMLELQGLFGENSAIPKQIVRQVIPTLELAWQDPSTPTRLSVMKGSFEVRGPLSFIGNAQQKLAAFATA